MKRFEKVTARVAVLDRADVDTDQIIPKQFLKRIERTGYGEFLFFDWAKDPGFELHRPQFAGARILLTGRNFGCGSSREHAAWALQDAGYDAVIAPSFGDIFRTNSLKIGLLPVALPAAEIRVLMEVANDGGEMTIDLEALELIAPDRPRIPFQLDAFERERLLGGLDDIALTLRRDPEITAYEAAHPARVATISL
ncbi:MAG: 3-isopropylmalate dehydratase small subunit [Gaiellaceae bacterium MAG52_C11]|nr:3-isopropylmalate dehydratase small subunit [Candidatus Gaiellasilicea maunaloa]